MLEPMIVIMEGVITIDAGVLTDTTIETTATRIIDTPGMMLEEVGAVKIIKAEAIMKIVITILERDRS